MATKIADFDEWMSGREWLGAKAPAEGFYGRYRKEDLDLMRIAFNDGANDRPLSFNKIDLKFMNERQSYNVKWCHGVGWRLTRKLNEKSE